MTGGKGIGVLRTPDLYSSFLLLLFWLFNNLISCVFGFVIKV